MAPRGPLGVTVTLDDGRAVHVQAWAGAGRPLVLLHGLLDSSAGWAELARSSDRPCYAIDLPGFGRSEPPSKQRFSAYAEDVVFVLRSLGVRSCTLVGHSLGGGVAASVAERDPARIAGLVLSAPAGFGSLRLAELAALPVVRELTVTTLPRLLTNRFAVHVGYRAFVTNASGPGPAEELCRRLAAGADRAGPGLDAALGALAAASRSPSAFHRRAIAYDGPVWGLWGDRDGLVPPRHATGLRAALPQTDLHIWRGMGHHPQRERPTALAAFVERAAAATELRPAAGLVA